MLLYVCVELCLLLLFLLPLPALVLLPLFLLLLLLFLSLLSIAVRFSTWWRSIALWLLSGKLAVGKQHRCRTPVSRSLSTTTITSLLLLLLLLFLTCSHVLLTVLLIPSDPAVLTRSQVDRRWLHCGHYTTTKSGCNHCKDTPPTCHVISITCHVMYIHVQHLYNVHVGCISCGG